MTRLSTTTFIFDIDSTIANNDHRAVLLTKHCRNCGELVTEPGHRAACPACGCEKHDTPQKCWDAFLSPELLMQDEPIAEAQRLITHLRAHKMNFHFITGRNDGLRLPTERWLSKHFDWPGLSMYTDRLYMRPSSMENVPASQCKEYLLQQLMRDYNLTQSLDKFVFFEDDKHVFGMYRKYGLVVECPAGLKYWCPDHDTTVEPSWKR